MIFRRNALRLGAIAVLGLLGRGVARAADALVIESDGATIFAKKINFGNPLAEKLTLFPSGYAIGIQHSTSYSRSDKNFAWYKGGKHSDTALDPGGGTRMMSLEDGTLNVPGTVNAGTVNAGTVKAEALVTSSGVSLASVRGALDMLIPIGTIMAYGGDTRKPEVRTQLINRGWLPCDGNVFKTDEYKDLFAAIGNAFGAGDAGTFRVPDFRGRFLRGADQNTQRDPDAQSRLGSSGGPGGDNVGSVQDDEFKQHTHQYQKLNFVGPPNAHLSGNQWNPDDGGRTGPAGGKETRPKNVYVNWIIKATPVAL